MIGDGNVPVKKRQSRKSGISRPKGRVVLDAQLAQKG
jgi:hypothetical protein